MDALEIDNESALREVLKNAVANGGLVKGLRECLKALEKRKALFCILSESCDEAAYTNLIEGICQEVGVTILKVSDSKKLGEMIGLCKRDNKGIPRKIVSVSCAVVSDIGEDSREWKYLSEKHKINVVVN